MWPLGGAKFSTSDALFSQSNEDIRMKIDRQAAFGRPYQLPQFGPLISNNVTPKRNLKCRWGPACGIRDATILKWWRCRLRSNGARPSYGLTSDVLIINIEYTLSSGICLVCIYVCMYNGMLMEGIQPSAAMSGSGPSAPRYLVYE